MVSPCFADPLVILALPAYRRLTLCRVAGQYFVVWGSKATLDIKKHRDKREWGRRRLWSFKSSAGLC